MQLSAAPAIEAAPTSGSRPGHQRNDPAHDHYGLDREVLPISGTTPRPDPSAQAFQAEQAAQVAELRMFSGRMVMRCMSYVCTDPWMRGGSAIRIAASHDARGTPTRRGWKLSRIHGLPRADLLVLCGAGALSAAICHAARAVSPGWSRPGGASGTGAGGSAA